MREAIVHLSKGSSMIIGNSFHTYNLNNALQTIQNATKPVEKTAPINGDAPRQNTQQQDNDSSLDSLGQGQLI
jgi:hypothetical protein